MRPHEREELARLVYLRAVALARAEPTDAASWRRLLRASKNLKAAVRDRARTRVRWYARAQVGAPPAPAPARGARADTPSVAPRPPERPREASPAATAPRATAPLGAAPRAIAPLGAAPLATRFADLERELERARSLVAWSQRLAEESRAIRFATAAVLAPERRKPPRDGR